jgi:PAS domain S-box-containing protein
VLGLTISDIGRSLGKVVAGVENLDRLCAQVIADGAPCRRETRDGDRYFLLRIAPYTGSDGQIQGAILTFTNVTAFRASIDQAIYEREYTKAILNTAIDPLVVLDAQLRVQTANRAFYAMFGVSRDETQGVSIRKLGNKDWEASEVWKSVETTLSGDSEFQAVEINRDFPTAGRRTVVLHARRLAREGDALILLAFQDITELRESERRYRTLFDVAPIAVYSCDASGVIREYNSCAAEMWGRKPKSGDTEERFCGSFKLFRSDGSFMPHEQCPMVDVLSGKIPGVRDAEVHMERPDGSRIIANVNIAPQLNEGGQITGAINCFYDVTQRKQTEERLRMLADTLETQVQARTQELEQRNLEVLKQAEQVRDLSNRLLENQDNERRRVARELHDGVGQLLAAINMNLSKLDKPYLSPDARRSLMESFTLIEQATKEIRTVSHLLHPPLLDEIGLEPAVRWYVEGFAKRSKIAVNMQLAAGFSKGLPRDVALSLFRVVQECLTNIHRHSGSETAFVGINRSPAEICLEVKDEGKGISPDLRAKLAAGESSGVGLRGMRERIQQLGGRLEIDSNGHGTRVGAVLPLDELAIPELKKSDEFRDSNRVIRAV